MIREAVIGRKYRWMGSTVHAVAYLTDAATGYVLLVFRRWRRGKGWHYEAEQKWLFERFAELVRKSRAKG